jgi:Uma2 family endonuclease
MSVMSNAAVVIEDGIWARESGVRVPADVFDLPGFLRWVRSGEFPERGRISFLDGEVNVDMSPEELRTHNFLKGDLYSGVDRWVSRLDLGQMFSDRSLLVNEAANLSTEPDIMFCRWKTLTSGRARLFEVEEGSGRWMEVHGSPDLVIEIISATSVYKDTKRLPPRYFAAGVKEYWIVDARGDEIDFRVLRRGKRGFVPVKPDADGYLRSRVLGGSFRLVRKRTRIGGWKYRLLSKDE